MVEVPGLQALPAALVREQVRGSGSDVPVPVVAHRHVGRPDDRSGDGHGAAGQRRGVVVEDGRRRLRLVVGAQLVAVARGQGDGDLAVRLVGVVSDGVDLDCRRCRAGVEGRARRRGPGKHRAVLGNCEADGQRIGRLPGSAEREARTRALCFGLCVRLDADEGQVTDQVVRRLVVVDGSDSAEAGRLEVSVRIDEAGHSRRVGQLEEHFLPAVGDAVVDDRDPDLLDALPRGPGQCPVGVREVHTAPGGACALGPVVRRGRFERRGQQRHIEDQVRVGALGGLVVLDADLRVDGVLECVVAADVVLAADLDEPNRRQERPVLVRLDRPFRLVVPAPHAPQNRGLTRCSSRVESPPRSLMAARRFLLLSLSTRSRPRTAPCVRRRPCRGPDNALEMSPRRTSMCPRSP